MLDLINNANPAAANLAAQLGISVELLSVLIVIITIWSLVWKGLALWKSARKNHLVWFVVMLVVNTIGILEILYIFVFSEMGKNKGKAKKVKKGSKS